MDLRLLPTSLLPLLSLSLSVILLCRPVLPYTDDGRGSANGGGGERVCDTVCVCIPQEAVIVCNKNDQIRQLPLVLSTQQAAGVTKVMIQNAEFQSPFLKVANLTGFMRGLEYLKIIYSGLVSVESRAFDGMTKLQYLDLSHNALRIIEPYTFAGLKLGQLHLMENRGLKLQNLSFAGLQVQSINLRSNEISRLSYTTFAVLSPHLRELFLYNNRISTLDPQFAAVFELPQAFIDLTGNPLSCFCEMKWLLPILRKKMKDPTMTDRSPMKSASLKCASPLQLAGRTLSSLTVKDMACPAPAIKAVSVEFGLPLTRLTCVAATSSSSSGSTFRMAPGIKWNYAEPNKNAEKVLRRSPHKVAASSDGPISSSLSINVSLSSASSQTKPPQAREFTCSTWLEDSDTEQIVVSIRGPPPIPTRLQIPPKSPLVTTRTPSSDVRRNRSSSQTQQQPPLIEPDNDHNSFIFKKQFTVLEMIGAVVGTFIATLVLLMLFAQGLKWWRRRQKADAEYKNVNLLKPYWTLGHDSTNTYSHPISTTDYDLPRVYESHTPSMCQSPPLNRMEFIDYKTQNRIYTS